MLLVQAEDVRLVVRLAQGPPLHPNVVLVYTGADVLADVKMNLEVACTTAPVAGDKEEVMQQLDALATGVPLWGVVEKKRCGSA